MDIAVAVVLGLAAAWGLLVVILWLLRPRGVSARELVGLVPSVARLVHSLMRDRLVPMDVRVVLVAVTLWLLSPIDLIPEFVPVLGPLDDVVVAILGLRYVRRRLGRAELARRWTGSDDSFALLRRVLG